MACLLPYIITIHLLLLPIVIINRNMCVDARETVPKQADPLTDQIKSWRRAGKTWQEVADNLADKKYLGYQMAPGPICRFMGRIKRRPYPLGAEPLTPSRRLPPRQNLETFPRKPLAASSRESGNGPKARDNLTPSPRTLHGISLSSLRNFSAQANNAKK